MPNVTTSELQPQALLTQYIHIVNRAIGEHQKEFPYAQLTKLGQKLIDDKPIDVAIYKTDPKAPHDHHTLRLDGPRLTYVEHGAPSGDAITWRVNQKHLENVVSDPDPFIEKPAKLDLDWISTRLS